MYLEVDYVSPILQLIEPVDSNSHNYLIQDLVGNGVSDSHVGFVDSMLKRVNFVDLFLKVNYVKLFLNLVEVVDSYFLVDLILTLLRLLSRISFRVLLTRF